MLDGKGEISCWAEWRVEGCPPRIVVIVEESDVLPGDLVEDVGVQAAARGHAPEWPDADVILMDEKGASRFFCAECH